MANIGHLFICETIFDDPENGMIVKKPFAVLPLINTPTTFSFSIVVGLFNLVSTENYNFNFVFNCEDEVVIEENFEFPYSSATPIHNNSGSCNLNMNFGNVRFNKEGLYKLTVTLTDHLVTKVLDIPVIIVKEED